MASYVPADVEQSLSLQQLLSARTFHNERNIDVLRAGEAVAYTGQ